ncbi:Ku70/Ku80 C-terminal arm domain and Ku70/Ku80 beta-barrel domain and SPOC like C-terminal domain-containing protein [Strongyloides ratti]|uniref:Ku70/Ku80 C-terminal arm domain and Ku70/Ku80 beta-barrel domain and SPOC like C-terminal domain-containing protein n=1 Tax=Strongyloides ratti TaxID=34506 RepID=A0A090LP77_STRRB|nr:Ku70/Ku80 C-terminal arm domain and Ku70/Ku80 beta-barrel domain and SPOC like C-terminal domain-containing protein [Strongyloides ratti]CEF69999.1 Ku70/Ku80 C-terminal arm domain and Ku70/Ku80 beta-barrel domain and SPOC like C-terminal domain-containing protein [Strongyloides ratti]
MSYLEGSIVIFFDGLFKDKFSFDKGKNILEKIIINKMMTINKDNISLYINIPCFKDAITLTADITKEHFFNIKKIIKQLVYSRNIECNDIFVKIIETFTSREISTRLRKKENINVLIISDLSLQPGSNSRIDDFELCISKFLLNIYLFGVEINNQSNNLSPISISYLKLISPDRCFSFDKSLEHVKYFVTSTVKPLNAKINFIIDEDYIVPLIGYVNQVKIQDKFNINKTIGQDNDKKLKRTYVYKNDKDEEIESDCIIDAYQYGNQLVPFNFFDQLYHSMEPGIKSLKLLKFAPISDIDLSFLESPVYHYFLDKSNSDLANRGEKLIEAMIGNNVVAIGSRILSKNSKPKLVVMFPGICKDSSEPILITFISIFKESINLIDIPSENKIIESLTTNDISLMDSYIDTMMLESHNNRYKPEHTPDPFYQSKLSTIIEKVTDEISYDKSYIKEILNLDKDTTEKCKYIEKKLFDCYGYLE